MNRLRELRNKRRLTLREVAEKLNMSFSNVATIERGESQLREDTAKIFADFYNVSIDYLLGNTDNPTESNQIDVAFYDQHGIVTEEQKKEIENFIAFIKSRDKK